MTRESMSLRMWMHALLDLARVTDEQVKPHRAMLHRWYEAGERYDLAARDLRFMCKLPREDADAARLRAQREQELRASEMALADARARAARGAA